mgnify:CR=1 FL=1
MRTVMRVTAVALQNLLANRLRTKQNTSGSKQRTVHSSGFSQNYLNIHDKARNLINPIQILYNSLQNTFF